jgi:N-methylhydantoinase B
VSPTSIIVGGARTGPRADVAEGLLTGRSAEMNGIPEACLDAITVEVVRHKLDGIANEMETTLLRSSFSAIVKEGQDASASLFTVDGETLAQAIAIPIHLSTLIPMVRVLTNTFPVPSMKEGDIYILNDPYLGGTHLPDVALVMPVFHRQRVIALSATLTHHQDIGGLTPGSVPTNAVEIFQEGVRIPALKLRDAGIENETLVRLLRKNVRMPDAFIGDLNAQIAACTVGSRRLEELASHYGPDQLACIFAELLDRSERMTRQALLAIPEGCYRYVDYLDNDGVVIDRKIRIEVAVTIKDGIMVCDFSGTDPQGRGPLNCVPSGSQAAAYFAVRAITDPDIPTNGGCFRPVKLILPEGSVVNPIPPAPVNARTATIKRVTGCILGALRQALPSKVPADAAGELRILMFGSRTVDGASQIVGEFVAGGSGASEGCDGVDVIDTDATNGLNLPVEALEADMPIRVLRFGLRQDSGGAGEFRGGLGAVREYQILSGEVILTHRGERHKLPAAGVQKGDSGALARGVVHRINGQSEEIQSKLVTTLRAGDRLVVETPGGGGFGNPLARNRTEVDADLRNGKVSKASARSLYGLSEEVESSTL